MKLTAQQYRQRAADAHAKAKAINDRASAEGRDLTAEEQAEFDGAITSGNEAAAAARQADARSAALSGLAESALGDVALAAVPAASGILVGEDRATLKPFRSFGEYLVAVARAGSPGGVVDPRLLPMQAGPTGMGTGVPSDGGFLVGKTYTDALLARVRETAILYPKCFEIPIGPNENGAEAPYIDETSRATGSRWGGVQVYRRGEAETVTATKTKIGKWSCDLEDLMGLAYASDRALRDAVQLEAILSAAFESEMAFSADDEIFRGNGVGQCLGVLNAAATITQAKEGSQTADTVNANNVAKMYSRMKPSLQNGAEWFINSAVFPQLMTMTISNQPIWLPPNGFISAPGGILLGKPVNIIEQASAIGDLGDILYANLKDYGVVTKGGIQADSSMHVRFLYGERTFRWVWPFNGQPLAKTVPTAYKGANTQGAFVILEAR